MERFKKYLKVFFVSLFIVFEELAWNKVGEPIYRNIKSLKIMERFKVWVGEVEHRYLLLLIFIHPFILMEVFSLLAISSFASGAIITGIGLYAIKLLMTAPVVIIFNAGKDELLTFSLIHWVYGLIIAMKRSKTFRGIKSYMAEVKEQVKVFKESYIDGDGEFKEELKKLYNDIKNIKG